MYKGDWVVFTGKLMEQPISSFGAVLVAAVVGAIIAAIIVVFRMFSSGFVQKALDFLASKEGVTALAWALLGASLGCLVTVLASGMSNEPRLLVAMLSNPSNYLILPAIIGAIAGLSTYIIRQR